VGESILMVPKLEKARRACLGSSVMMAGPGRRGVRHRTVDDTSARAFDTSFAGRGTTIIRNMRGMIRSSAADALEARVTRYE